MQLFITRRFMASFCTRGRFHFEQTTVISLVYKRWITEEATTLLTGKKVTNNARSKGSTPQFENVKTYQPDS